MRNRKILCPVSRRRLVLMLVAAFATTVSGIYAFPLASSARAQSATTQPTRISGIQSSAVSHANINFGEIASAALVSPCARSKPVAIHRPLAGRIGDMQPEQEGSPYRAEVFDDRNLGRSKRITLGNRTGAELHTTNFPGQGDTGNVTPPDTQGTVGPNHLMVALNNNVTIQSRTGATLSSVPIAGFWSSLGNINEAFDPRVLFDANANRWIMSSGANAATPSSYILIGVSATSDPTAGWFLYKVAVSASGDSWADYPTLGYNGDWIVVQTNVFSVATTAFLGSNIYSFNKADLYAGGVGQYTMFHDNSGYTDYPAVTHDPTLATEYLVRNWNGPAGMLRISTISGSVGAEVMTVGAGWVVSANTWQDFAPVTNFAPQLGSVDKIDTDDSRIENCVYRNGSLWMAQTAYLPASGTPARSSAQWWQINTAGGSLGQVQQQGRVDDPSQQFDFAYPTLDVNSSDDMMIGYSRFGASQYASADYSIRMHNDPPDTLRADVAIKAGEAPYFKDFGTGDNRWGDYSNTAVDPVNDRDLWTIQEYAGVANSWGTWWGTVAIAATPPTPTPTATPTPTRTPTPIRTPTPTHTPRPRKRPRPRRTPDAMAF